MRIYCLRGKWTGVIPLFQFGIWLQTYQIYYMVKIILKSPFLTYFSVIIVHEHLQWINDTTLALNQICECTCCNYFWDAVRKYFRSIGRTILCWDVYITLAIFEKITISFNGNQMRTSYRVYCPNFKYYCIILFQIILIGFTNSLLTLRGSLSTHVFYANR